LPGRFGPREASADHNNRRRWSSLQHGSIIGAPESETDAPRMCTGKLDISRNPYEQGILAHLDCVEGAISRPNFAFVRRPGSPSRRTFRKADDLEPQ
jgi:hypothetical protein